MRPLVCLASFVLALSGCAAGDTTTRDGGADAQAVWPDSGPRDDAGPDPADAGDASEDAGADEDGGGSMDAGSTADGGADASDAAMPPDAATPSDAGAGCPSISAGDTPSLDGSGDLAMYPSDQIVVPFAPFGSGDQLGITWDPEYLYVTLVTDYLMGSGGESKPLHVYVEATSGALPAATPGMGKEYDTLTPHLPFTPTHLIAARRTSDLGGPGPYNGVYEPTGGWSARTYPLALGADYWTRADGGAISVRVPWTALGCPTRLRLSAHLVNGPIIANEWKDIVPSGAQPWSDTEPGTHYEIDLTGDPAISGWTEVGP